MLLKLIENLKLENTKVTVEYKEKNEQVNKIISFAVGVETIPVTRLAELFLLSVPGGIWMEFSFGTCFIKRMADAKWACIFVAPFAAVTFICGVLFRWITELTRISTYIKFAGIFLVCLGISILFFEVEHRIRGKNTRKNLRNIKREEKSMINKEKDLEKVSFGLAVTIPSCQYEKKKVPVKTVLLCFLLQFTSILASSFCFAVVHGVSLGIPQVVYTFILGMIWSYLTVKTGDIKLAIFMHGLSNLFGSIITQTLLGISLAAAGIYSMVLILLGITGLVLFLANRKKNCSLRQYGACEKSSYKRCADK